VGVASWDDYWTSRKYMHTKNKTKSVEVLGKEASKRTKRGEKYPRGHNAGEKPDQVKTGRLEALSKSLPPGKSGIHCRKGGGRHRVGDGPRIGRALVQTGGLMAVFTRKEFLRKKSCNYCMESGSWQSISGNKRSFKGERESVRNKSGWQYLCAKDRVAVKVPSGSKKRRPWGGSLVTEPMGKQDGQGGQALTLGSSPSGKERGA